MAYNRHTWKNNEPPALSAGNLNQIEQGIVDAHEALEQVYTKDQTYNKNEIYNKTETYSSDEVYSKAESKDLVEKKFAIWKGTEEYVGTGEITSVLTLDQARELFPGTYLTSNTKPLEDLQIIGIQYALNNNTSERGHFTRKTQRAVNNNLAYPYVEMELDVESQKYRYVAHFYRSGTGSGRLDFEILLMNTGGIQEGPSEEE